MFAVIGEALVDVVRRAGEPSSVRHPGGSPANVAVGLARLGGQVRLATCLGQDADGELLRDHLSANAVEVVAGSPAAVGSSVAEATVGADGAASYDFRIDWRPDEEAVREACAGVACVHTGSIAAVLPPGSEVVRRALIDARENATTSYDPNCRPALMGHPAAVAPLVESLVSLCDVVKASDEDLRWLYPGRDPRDVARVWLGLGPALVAVTLGGEGCYGVVGAGTTSLPAVPVSVVDTVGAGDSFMAGILDGLRRRGLLGREHADSLRRLSVDDLGAVLGRAARIAAITCSRPGADPPTADELGEPDG